jgi:hypothetical protein
VGVAADLAHRLPDLALLPDLQRRQGAAFSLAVCCTRFSS